ncbi:hypothetical protein ACTXT7_003202 [Hymenolepis weldensis]
MSIASLTPNFASADVDYKLISINRSRILLAFKFYTDVFCHGDLINDLKTALFYSRKSSIL